MRASKPALRDPLLTRFSISHLGGYRFCCRSKYQPDTSQLLGRHDKVADQNTAPMRASRDHFPTLSQPDSLYPTGGYSISFAFVPPGLYRCAYSSRGKSSRSKIRARYRHVRVPAANFFHPNHPLCGHLILFNLNRRQGGTLTSDLIDWF